MQPVAPGHDQGLHHHGHPEIGFVAHALPGKSRRGHADHGERCAQNLDGRAQHGDVAAKALLPIVITDDRIRVLSRSFGFVAVEEAPDRRIDAEHGKIFF